MWFDRWYVYMDSDFMNHLADMLKNGNIPEEMKEKMNGFINQTARTKYQYAK